MTITWLSYVKQTPCTQHIWKERGRDYWSHDIWLLITWLFHMQTHTLCESYWVVASYIHFKVYKLTRWRRQTGLALAPFVILEPWQQQTSGKQGLRCQKTPSLIPRLWKKWPVHTIISVWATMRFMRHLTHSRLSRHINRKSMCPENGYLWYINSLKCLGECIKFNPHGDNGEW